MGAGEGSVSKNCELLGGSAVAWLGNGGGPGETDGVNRWRSDHKGLARHAKCLGCHSHICFLINLPNETIWIVGKKISSLQSPLLTFRRCWDKRIHHGLLLRRAGRQEHWPQLHIAFCSLTLPFAIHWSGGHIVQRWKWHLHCTSHRLRKSRERWGQYLSESGLPHCDLDLQNMLTFAYFTGTAIVVNFLRKLVLGPFYGGRQGYQLKSDWEVVWHLMDRRWI